MTISVLLSSVTVLGIASYLAGMLPLSVQMSQVRTAQMSTLGTGLLLGAAMGVIIPEGVEAIYDSISAPHIHGLDSGIHTDSHASNPSFIIACSLLLGFTVMFVIEQIVTPALSSRSNKYELAPTTESADRAVNHAQEIPDKDPRMMTLGLVIHSFADGMALGAANALDQGAKAADAESSGLSLVVFIAIAVHKAPTALALTTTLLTQLPVRQIKQHLLAFSLASPLSALSTYIFLAFLGGSENLAGYTGIALMFSFIQDRQGPSEERFIDHAATIDHPIQGEPNEAQQLDGEPITREELDRRYTEEHPEIGVVPIKSAEDIDADDDLAAAFSATRAMITSRDRRHVFRTSRVTGIEITPILLDAAQLADAIFRLSKQPVPPAPPELQTKARWIHCTVRNETQFQLAPVSTYFYSGRFWDAPRSMTPTSLMVFTACNKDWSVATGVSGGTAFQLILQDDVRIHISLGWSNPYTGTIKAGAVLSKNPAYGLDVASENGNYIESPDVYYNHDGDIRIRFIITASPGQYTRFSVTQVIV
ncbi:hypothetical protein FRB94_012988 [Tulasnella sp. JGI-2019a]|nr:hypothetical protein FRB94_012988 [Tulasnella sp. JGI-2019a]